MRSGRGDPPQRPEKLRAVIDALAEGGVQALEITMTVPRAIEMIAEIAPTLPREFILGAGTVLDAPPPVVPSARARALWSVRCFGPKSSPQATRCAGDARVFHTDRNPFRMGCRS